jgi:hypothetical protein
METQRRWCQSIGYVNAPKVDAFLDEIAKVCRKHGLSISHEDGHGSFVIEAFHNDLEEWLRDAAIGETAKETVEERLP